MKALETAHNMGFLQERPQGIYTKIKLTSYSNGLGECVYTKLHTDDLRRKRKKNKGVEDETDIKEECETITQSLPSLADLDFERDNKERSLRRARSTVRKKIIEGELDHLLTLTYKANMIDEKQGWIDFQKFIRSLRKVYPNVKWLVVMEKQKRGAIHFHLAVHGFFQASVLRGLWLDVCYQGNIDIVRKRKNQTLQGLAGYLSKYLSKQKDNMERFGKMFRSSQNIKLTELHFFLPADYWLDNRIARLFVILHERILTRWDSGNMGAFHSKFIASF